MKDTQAHIQGILDRARAIKYDLITPEVIDRATKSVRNNMIAHGIRPETADRFLDMDRVDPKTKDRRYTIADKLTEPIVREWHRQYMEGVSLEQIAQAHQGFKVSRDSVRKSFDTYNLPVKGRRGEYSDKQYKEWHDYYLEHQVTIGWIAKNLAEGTISKSAITSRWRKLGLTGQLSDNPAKIYTCPECGRKFERFHSLAGHANTHKRYKKKGGGKAIKPS